MITLKSPKDTYSTIPPNTIKKFLKQYVTNEISGHFINYEINFKFEDLPNIDIDVLNGIEKGKVTDPEEIKLNLIKVINILKKGITINLNPTTYEEYRSLDPGNRNLFVKTVLKPEDCTSSEQVEKNMKLFFGKSKDDSIYDVSEKLQYFYKAHFKDE